MRSFTSWNQTCKSTPSWKSMYAPAVISLGRLCGEFGHSDSSNPGGHPLLRTLGVEIGCCSENCVPVVAVTKQTLASAQEEDFQADNDSLLEWMQLFTEGLIESDSETEWSQLERRDRRNRTQKVHLRANQGSNLPSLSHSDCETEVSRLLRTDVFFF